MKEMTSHERFSRCFAHTQGDRIPIFDIPWDSTIERWQREGLPTDTDTIDYFGLDRVEDIFVDNGPRFEVKVIEETEVYKIYTNSWGSTLKEWKHKTSTPDFLDFTIKDPESWRTAKARITPTRDRIPWDRLAACYKDWREKGTWIKAILWFGYDVTAAWVVGTERLLRALYQQPEWCVEMFNHELDVDLALLDMVWEAGYTFDEVMWPDDMGFKGKQFFGLETYRALLKPIHQRAIEWAHAKGIKAHLHSCGDVNPFIPDLIEIGLDALHPLEVKAGMNPLAIKQKFGRDLVLHGGINAVLWDQVEAIEAEMRRTVPAMKESGGYIFSSDHSVPDSVSLEDFRRIIALAKQLGRYD